MKTSVKIIILVSVLHLIAGPSFSLGVSNRGGISPDASTGPANNSATITITPQSLTFGDVLVGTNSEVQTYTITGSNLTAPVTVTAPSRFSVSENGWIWRPGISLPHTNGNLNATVYIRFTPADTTAYSSNTTNESTGATTQNVMVSGTGMENSNPFIIVEPESLIQYGNYLGTCTPAVTYRIYCNNLTENLFIYSDDYFGLVELSLNGENNFTSTLTLVPVNGIVDTTIYVKHCPGFYDPMSYIFQSSSGVEETLDVWTWSIVGNAPVTKISHVTADPGTTVSVPVKAIDFNYISQIQYIIEFDPTVLSFLELDNHYLREGFISTSVVGISPTLSRLIIDAGCQSDVYMSAPDNETIFDLVFAYTSGYTTLNFGDCSIINFFGTPNDEPDSVYYFNGSVSSSIKTTSLTLNLEGLYNPGILMMNKAMGETAAYFPGDIADQLSIKLVSDSLSLSAIIEMDSVNLDQNGQCRFNIPFAYNGHYYIAVSHRNSIETWSAIPVSYNGSAEQYNFTTSANKAFGNNMKLIDGRYCFYSGDVNQDGTIDTGDQTPVENDASGFTTGYLPTDINGDGSVDIGDMTIIDNNAVNFIETNYPSYPSLPALFTDAVTETTVTTAICGGGVISQGNSPVTAKGVCWSTSSEPTISNSHTIDGSETGNFVSNLAGLIPDTYYYLRAYATNNSGTAYGNEKRFKSAIFSPGSGVTDIDNNHYNTVIIGYQEWMAGNLKVTHYNNGDLIPNVTGQAQWGAMTTGAYSWYNNDEISFKDTYGALYNFYTIADNRSLCPVGWHIPSDAEWNELITDYLGGSFFAGTKMKSTGGWNNNGNGNNISGFTGLPGGLRSITEGFRSEGSEGYWWSSTDNYPNSAWRRDIYADADIVSRHEMFKPEGLSVRCLKD